jgi:DNA (cytosine-5)-methyltransferase 1
LNAFSDGGQQQQQKDIFSVRDAISDLPKLDNGEKKTSYKVPPQNYYQEELREDVGTDELTHHKCPPHRENTRMRYKHIPQGGNAGDIPEEYAEYKPNSYYYARNRKLTPEEPSYTVTSHVREELLHYDPDQPRVLTVRETARLQSFPDDYTFSGRRVIPHIDDEESQYQQVGNSVPPKLAYHIGKIIKQSLA